MIERLQCPVGGGLLLMDRAKLASFKSGDLAREDWVRAVEQAEDWDDLVENAEVFDPIAEMSVALDAEGQTCHNNEDLPPEEWKAEWRHMTRRLVDMVNRGEMALFVFNDGAYWVDTDIYSPHPTRPDLVAYRSRLEVPSGTLAIAEAAAFIANEPTPKTPEPRRLRYREIAVTPGWYDLSAFAGTPTKGAPWGRYGRWEFGAPDEPVLHVRLDRSDSTVAPIVELPHLEYFPQPDHGA